MSTITTIYGSDRVSDSRSVLNTNFSNLNNQKQATYVVSTNGDYGDYSDLTTAVAAASSGGKIFVKAGSYTLSSAVTFAASNIVIEGEGPATIINFDGSTIPTAFKMADTTQRTGIQIRNLQINSTSSGSGTAVDASHFAISRLSDLWIGGCNVGIDFNASDTFYNIAENIRVSVSGASSIGGRLSNDANENTFLRWRIITTSASTGVVVNSTGNSLYDVDVETGAALGIDIQSSGHGTTIYGCWLEGNVTNLQIASGVEATTIVGGNIHSGSSADISDSGTGTQYLNCRVNFDPYIRTNGFPTTINMGATSGTAILLAKPTLGAAGHTDSDYIVFQGVSNDGSAHNIDYKFITNVTTNAAGSQFLIQSRTDANSFVTKLVLDGSGALGVGNMSSVNSKAVLDLTSTTTKGFLPPKLTTTQRDAITSPTEGLVIYNTSTHKLNVFTTGWEQVTSA